MSGGGYGSPRAGRTGRFPPSSLGRVSPVTGQGSVGSPRVALHRCRANKVAPQNRKFRSCPCGKHRDGSFLCQGPFRSEGGAGLFRLAPLPTQERSFPYETYPDDLPPQFPPGRRCRCSRLFRAGADRLRVCFPGVLRLCRFRRGVRHRVQGGRGQLCGRRFPEPDRRLAGGPSGRGRGRARRHLQLRRLLFQRAGGPVQPEPDRRRPRGRRCGRHRGGGHPLGFHYAGRRGGYRHPGRLLGGHRPGGRRLRRAAQHHRHLRRAEHRGHHEPDPLHQPRSRPAGPAVRPGTGFLHPGHCGRQGFLRRARHQLHRKERHQHRRSPDGGGSAGGVRGQGGVHPHRQHHHDR